MSEVAFAPDSAARLPVTRVGPYVRPRYLLGVAGLALAYYGAARLGYAVGFSGSVAAIVWLPAGVGIAALSLGGLSFWPGVLLGDLVVDVHTGVALGPGIGQTIGNMLEVVVAALLIRRWARRHDRRDCGRDGD
jgi:integral membrane sensor domain MASE1